MLKFRVPLPPSTNNLYRDVTLKDGKRRGRITTGEYRAWQDKVATILKDARLHNPVYFGGNYGLEIHGYRPRIARDLDNIVKPINDAMKKNGVIKDDRYNTELICFWKGKGEHADVFVRAIP